jgi:hypothetical protein
MLDADTAGASEETMLQAQQFAASSCNVFLLQCVTVLVMHCLVCYLSCSVHSQRRTRRTFLTALLCACNASSREARSVLVACMQDSTKLVAVPLAWLHRST